MPQVVLFPSFTGDARVILIALAGAAGAQPRDEPFAAFRTRMRDIKAWDDQAPAALLAYLDLPGGAVVNASPFMSALAASQGDDAILAAHATHLFAQNPILAKTTVMLVTERAYGKDELYKVLGSSVYRGVVPSRPAVEAWLGLAAAVGVLRPLGIAMAKGPRFDEWQRLAADIDIDEYLATDVPTLAPVVTIPQAPPAATAQPEASIPTAVSEVTGGLSIPVTAAAPAGALPPEWRSLGDAVLANPRADAKPVPVSAFASSTPLFDDAALATTASALAAWWQRAGANLPALGPADFGWDSEQWMERSDETLYRIAVAAALLFRLGADGAGVLAAYRQLESTGVLTDLFHGTVPEDLPRAVDGRALMLASLAARRCGEAPELAADVEKQPNAAAVFDTLANALGRGLFRSELFWMMDQLVQLGIVRHDDAADFTMVPHRIVRDTLFRLGFLPTPYAPDTAALRAASSAARRALGGAPPIALAAFSLAAGCAYDCTQKKSCPWACRERLD